MLARRDRRILPFDLETQTRDETVRLPESTWITPYPDDHLPSASGYASPEARYEQREACSS
jgi:hypothetical protein